MGARPWDCHPGLWWWQEVNNSSINTASSASALARSWSWNWNSKPGLVWFVGILSATLCLLSLPYFLLSLFILDLTFYYIPHYYTRYLEPLWKESSGLSQSNSEMHECPLRRPDQVHRKESTLLIWHDANGIHKG